MAPIIFKFFETDPPINSPLTLPHERLTFKYLLISKTQDIRAT